MESALTRVQRELKPWQNHNFTGRPAWQPLLGVSEEVGELHHAYLKRAQNIRGTAEEHKAAIEDAIADIIVFLCDFANEEEIDVEAALNKTWDKVRTRNWRPEKGPGPFDDGLDDLDKIRALQNY